MKNDSIQTIQRLETSLLDFSDESKTQLRTELEADGVDVTKFLSRLNGVVRKGYQHQMHLKSQTARDQANSTVGSIFGDLSAVGGEQLRALIERVLVGSYGSVAQTAARCRNYQGAELSDDDLRSWLQDVEKLAKK